MESKYEVDADFVFFFNTIIQYYSLYLSVSIGHRSLVDIEETSGEVVHANRVRQGFAQEFHIVGHPVDQLVEDRLELDGLLEFSARKRGRNQHEGGELQRENKCEFND